MCYVKAEGDGVLGSEQVPVCFEKNGKAEENPVLFAQSYFSLRSVRCSGKDL